MRCVFVFVRAAAAGLPDYGRTSTSTSNLHLQPTSLLAQGEVNPDVEVRRFAVLQVEAEVAFVMPSSDSAIGSGGAGIASTSVTGLRKARGVLFIFAFSFLFPRRRRRGRLAAATG